MIRMNAVSTNIIKAAFPGIHLDPVKLVKKGVL